MNKYQYSIKIHLAKDCDHLQEILNEYGCNGYRVFRVERTDHCIYENGACKYTLYLEQKVKKTKKSKDE